MINNHILMINYLYDLSRALTQNDMDWIETKPVLNRV